MSVALKDIIDTLDHMEDSDQSDKDRYADVLGNTSRSYFTDDRLREVLDDSLLDSELIEQTTSNL